MTKDSDEVVKLKAIIDQKDVEIENLEDQLTDATDLSDQWERDYNEAYDKSVEFENEWEYTKKELVDALNEVVDYEVNLKEVREELKEKEEEYDSLETAYNELDERFGALMRGICKDMAKL